MSTPHVHPHGELHNPDTAHESADISLRAIVSFVILLTVVTLAVQGAMYGVFRVFDRIETASDPAVSPLATPANEAPAEPRLQTTPWADLKTLRADETAYLHGYGWIDRQAGVARIPIDRAKALLLQKGLPVRQGPVDPAEGTSTAATGESTGGRNLPAGGPDTSTPSAGASGAPGASGASSPVAAPPKKPGGGQ
jgi:hypothetical protein